MGVMVNRPFQQGTLTRRLEGERLPDWSAEIGASIWAQFILKFILSHPAATGPMPDEAMRERMAAYVRAL